MAGKRSYGDAERAAALAALAANGGNLAKTAAETGVPRKTLADWQKRQESAGGGEELPPPKKSGPPPRPPLPAEEVVRAEGVLADELEAAIRGMVPYLRKQEKLLGADIKQVATALGILIDKMRLLRDQPTTINANGLTDEQRVARVAELVDAARARRNGRVAGGLHAPAVETPAGPADARV